MSILYTKNSKFLKPSKLSQQLFESMQYGDSVELNENFSSSIEFVFIAQEKVGIERGELFYLSNTLKDYKLYSEKYDPAYYSESDVKMIKIPSIYFGSSIQKESVKLEVFYTGSLIGRLEDIGGKGELKQTYPKTTQNYDICGTVLYNHGIILLTGSSYVNTTNSDFYESPSVSDYFSWIFFGTGSDATINTQFNLQFNGTEVKPVLTINIPIEKQKYNFSNNATSFSSSNLPLTTSFYYKEHELNRSLNVVSSSFHNDSASYEKHTYITKIGLYDKNKNLIGVAKLATPILKTEDREYNIKLKLDL